MLTVFHLACDSLIFTVKKRHFPKVKEYEGISLFGRTLVVLVEQVTLNKSWFNAFPETSYANKSTGKFFHVRK